MNEVISNQNLIKKYNLPCPRYTSYPTVPYWDITPSENKWFDLLKDRVEDLDGNGKLSLYIHLPFCESLCTYCGCNTRITKNHKVEIPYMETLLNEWNKYLPYLKDIEIEELHLGGGTPTFFSSKNLNYLLDGILNTIKKSKTFSFGFEAHPANTTFGHLFNLKNLGFDRLSLGIQDFDLTVQKAINRFQTPKEVAKVVDIARSLSYSSINFDMIYGLPFQSIEAVENTFSEVIKMRPDRIAFYSYAHVPWKHKGQRRYTETDLPDNDFKRKLYDTGRAILEMEGYVAIGMDHFSLPEESLYKACLKGELHRNFMGYTTNKSDFLIGLGTSSISDIGTAMMQNNKVVEEYREEIENGGLAIEKGHVLSNSDQVVRGNIMGLMCHYSTELSFDFPISMEVVKSKMEAFIEDGLVVISKRKIQITKAGEPFVRMIALCIDERYWSANKEGSMFSRNA